MEKIKKFIKKNHNHIASIILLSGLCAFLFIKYFDAIKTFGYTFKYNFKVITSGFEYYKKDYFFSDHIKLPVDSFDGVKKYFNNFFNNVFNLKCFVSFCAFFLLKMIGIFIYVSYFFICIIPLFYGFKMIIISNYKDNENNKYNEDTKPLKFVKKYYEKNYLKLKSIIKSYIEFLKNHKFYLIIALVFVVFFFNGGALIVDFIVYYISMLFDLKNASFIPIINIFDDLNPLILALRPYFIIALIIAFFIVRRMLARKFRHRHEEKNIDYLNKAPIVDFLTGTMGSCKTSTITDIALSYNVIFKNKALELLSNNQSKFKDFPFINFENELKKQFKNHTIYNLATIKLFVSNKENIFNNKRTKENCFDYDFEKYGLYYNDKLNIVYLWDMLKNYAQEYFIYVIQSSLLISNYSIRDDLIKKDLGNFPKVDTDFFKRKIENRKDESKFAHVLDFDMLRIGRKIIQDNENQNIFEFGIINLTEIGKERGNKYDTAGQKKNDEATNQTNDLFNHWLKLCRHTATIENYPFVKVLMDDQRAMSLGADVRDLAEIVAITKVNKNKCAMPFYFEKWICHKMNESINKLMLDYRYYRGDNGLLGYLLKNVNALIYKHILSVENNYNYHEVIFNKYDVNGDSIEKDNRIKYYLAFKKIYAERYATDCYQDYFKPLKLDSEKGLNDLMPYKSIYATTDEFNKQNSYFIRELENLGKYQQIQNNKKK